MPSAVFRVVVVFAVAAVLNFAWEMTQSVLFAPMGGSMRGTWRCFVASLGDGVIVVIIGAIGWLWFRRADWMVRPGFAGYALTATAGIAIAILIERHALATGRWAYTERMPVLPVVHVGLVPVLQMVIVPAVTFWVVARLLKGKHWEIVAR